MSKKQGLKQGFAEDRRHNNIQVIATGATRREMTELDPDTRMQTTSARR